MPENMAFQEKADPPSENLSSIASRNGHIILTVIITARGGESVASYEKGL